MTTNSADATGLSDLQKRILEYFARYVDENRGRSPTLREIQRGARISSTSVVKYNLAILERMGYVENDQTIARGHSLVRRLEA